MIYKNGEDRIYNWTKWNRIFKKLIDDNMKKLGGQENSYKKIKIEKEKINAIKNCVHHINDSCDCETRCIYYKK